jgi:inner membrane transporter RhtA
MYASGIVVESVAVSDRVPPHVYFVVSAVFHYLGPAFAVLLFARVDVLGVAWLRIASAAVVFALWRRPWRAFAALDRDGRRLLLAWGAVLAVMNACFYVAIDRLPLGTVAAIEFLPVIALAALGARSRRNVVALALAVPGVYLVTGVQLEGEPLGVALAFANALLFAAYIVLAHRVARHGGLSGIDGLAASMLIAAVVVTPIGGWQVLPAFTDPVALLAGAGVGICSSVIPYVSDQLAMRRLPRATYALMVSLLPATATVIGIVVLTQIPSPVEVAGVALVIAGVALHREPPEPRTRSARAARSALPARASARAAAVARRSEAAP